MIYITYQALETEIVLNTRGISKLKTLNKMKRQKYNCNLWHIQCEQLLCGKEIFTKSYQNKHIFKTCNKTT